MSLECSKSPRCVICGSAPVDNADSLRPLLRPDDFIIAADGGLKLLNKLEIKPDIIVADFDSMPKEQVMPENVPVIQLPVRKNDTDTMAAARIGLEYGFSDFLLLGTSGGRLDHTIANCSVMLYLINHKANAVMADEQNIMQMVLPGQVVVDHVENAYLSLLPYAGNVFGLTVKNAQYELENAVLTPDYPLGVSNRFVGAAVEISFSQGILMVFISKD